MPAPPPIGADPLAPVVGGIVTLALSAIALVSCRERLRSGPRLHPLAWIALGSVGALAIDLVGLAIMGRTREITPGAFVSRVPWITLAIVPVGGFLAYKTGARSGWHVAGVGLFLSLVVASIGWAGYLALTRVAAFLASPSFVGAALGVFVAAQLVALAFVCSASAYMLDGLVRRRWARLAADAPYDADHQPRVAVHVACYDEPAAVVIATLDTLVAQDYPREKLDIILLDDSRDPHIVEELRVACLARGVRFLHRDERTGFKAGALNAALRATPDDIELIAVVDADFQCKPEFIRETVGFFVDPELAFVQTRLAYRAVPGSWTARYASMMEQYFYSSMMRTRNEGNGILFCGTMGVLRRSAIVEAGGWCDGHVGEDVDLSCRLLLRGRKSLYVPKVYGTGLQVTDHEAFRRQHARWAYGGARILRDHGRAIVLGKMTPVQKAHHLYAPIFWFDGALGFLFALSMIGFASVFLSGHVALLPARDLVFVGLIPILVIIESMVRSAFTMRRLLGIGLRDMGGMVLTGWSNKLPNGIAAWAGLLGIPRPFVRTPKIEGERLTRRRALRQAVRAAPLETTMAMLQATLAGAMTLKLAHEGAGSIPAILVTAAIMMAVMWSLYFGAAPACIYLGHVTRPTAAQRVKASAATS